MKLVCGAVQFDGRPLPEDLVEAMSAAMTEGKQSPLLSYWKSPHAALATLDFSSDPESPRSRMRMRDSGAVFAGDVRLDQSAYLAEQLDCEASEHDTLAEGMLDRSGLLALRSLLGDFALADWNPRKRELLLARDAMGVRPLVYHFVPGRLVIFASFPRALHASGLLERKLDPCALIREMAGISAPGETLFEGVRSVKPGTSVLLSASRANEVVYWKPALSRGEFRRPEEGAEALGAAVRSAVASRTYGRQPVSAHLSGGLDSSAIAILAARRQQARGRCLDAYQFLQPQQNQANSDPERPYILAVTQQEPAIRLHRVAEAAFSLQPMLRKDRVLPGAPSDPESYTCAHAAERGVDLILSGWGGDEAATFNGRGALATSLLAGRWRSLGRTTADLQRRRGFTKWQIVHGEMLIYLRDRALSFLRPLQPQRGLVPLALRTMVEPRLRREALRNAEPPLRIGSNVRTNQLTLISGRHIEVRTTNWADIGAPHGIAFAFPLLDRRVIECALSLPASWHIQDGYKRYPFRQAMRGVLPEVIRRRHDKLTPFPHALTLLAEHRVDIRRRVEEMLAAPSLRQVFDAAAVRQTLALLPTPEQVDRDSRTLSPLLALASMIPYAEFYLREELQQSAQSATPVSVANAGRRRSHA